MPVNGHWVSWQCVLSWSSTAKKFKDNYYWLTDGDTCSHIWLQNYKGSEVKSDLIFRLATHDFPIGHNWSQTSKTYIKRDIWTFIQNRLIFHKHFQRKIFIKKSRNKILKTMDEICMKYTILRASLISSVIILSELLPSVWFLKRRFLNVNFPNKIRSDASVAVVFWLNLVRFDPQMK